MYNTRRATNASSNNHAFAHAPTSMQNLNGVAEACLNPPQSHGHGHPQHPAATQYLQFDNSNNSHFIISPADASAANLGSQYVTQYVKCIMPAYAAKDLHHQTIMIGPPSSMMANTAPMVDLHNDRSFLDPHISSVSSDTNITDSSNQGRSSRCRSSNLPEYKERQAEAARQRRQDPEYRRKEAEARRRRESDPEKLARKAEMMRIKRADPEYRARQAEARRRRESDPEKLARKAELMRIKRNDPAYKERQAQLRRLRRLNPDALERQAIYQRIKRSDPNYRARQAEKRRTKTNDPETLRKRAEYMRRKRADPTYLERERTRRQELRLAKQIRNLGGLSDSSRTSAGSNSKFSETNEHIDVNNFLSVMIHEGNS